MELNKSTYTPEQLALLERQKLEQLLQAELQKQTCDIDDTLVRMILRELETRGKDPALVDDAAVEAACDKFRKAVDKRPKSKVRWYNSWLLKAASVALVLGVLLFSLPGTAEADSIKDVLTRWTDSVFQFFSPGEKPSATQDYVFQTDNPGLQQVYDTVTELGITDPVVPMWVPDGFELQELKTYEMFGDLVIYASLVNDENYILVTYIIHDEAISFQHEKDMQNVNIVEMAGIEHYLLSNMGNYNTSWFTDRIECSLVTDCSKEEIIKLLKSIYSLED